MIAVHQGGAVFHWNSPYISPILGEDIVGPISMKIGTVVGVDDIIMHSNFRFNTLRGFRSTGVKISIFPLTSKAGDSYNSDAATWRYFHQ